MTLSLKPLTRSLFALGFTLAALSSGAQYTVNSTVDAVDAAPGDGVCADAAGNCTLRAAVMEANASAGANTVFVPIGEYTFTLAANNSIVADGGDLDITSEITITGEDARLTIVNADSLDRLFDVHIGAVLNLEFMTLTEGLVVSTAGGAIRNSGTVSLSELTIRSSTTGDALGSGGNGGLGGAVYNNGTLTIDRVTVHDCFARGARGANGVAPGGGSGGGGAPGMGGAIYNDIDAVCTITNSTFSSNTAQGGRGGNGTFHQGTGTVASAGGSGGGLNGGNAGNANGGGGVGGWGSGGGGGGSIGGAGAAGGFGGGGGGGGASSWGGNSGPPGAAGQYGGAGGQGCCSGGSGGGGGAGLGGAIFNRSATLDITNCTFAYNDAIGGNGGNGWFSGPGAVGNGKAGAIFNLSGTVNLNNSLFAENTSTSDAPSLFGSFGSAAGHNLVDLTDGGVTFTGTTTNNQLDVDPLILSLANNGGNTDTHLLQGCDPVSVAIDAGNDAFADATDQIGQARVNVSDIGAVEVAASAAALLPDDTTLCAGETLLLDATTPDATYLWSDGSTDPTLEVSEAGTYGVTISLNGCDSFDEIAVDYNPLESVDLGGDQVICPGESALLDATYPGATYLWQDGSTAPTFNASDDGTYTVTVTFEGCSASGSAALSFVADPGLDLGSDRSACENETVELEAGLVADSYTWSTGETTESITVDASGTYTLDVEVNGCTFSDDVAVDILPLPVVNLGADQALCEGESTVLDVSSQAGSYVWTDGSTSGTLTVSDPGTYGVTVDLDGCVASDELTISVNPLPVFELGDDVTVCYNAGFELTVETGLDNVSVSWSTGQTGASIAPSETAEITAIAERENCIFSDVIVVTVIEPIALDLGPDRLVCEGSTVRLESFLDGFQHPIDLAWSTGDFGPSLEVTRTGDYELIATTDCEVLSDRVEVSFEPCECSVYVPTAFTPDGDGLNEYFAVVADCSFERYLFQVFNRQGEVLFRTEDPNAIWDGSVNGGNYFVMDGAYVWRLEYTANTLESVISETLSGHVVVVR